MILDYVWKSLFYASISGSLVLALTLLSGVVLKRVSAGQRKWYFNLQIVLLLVLLGGSFFLAAVDQQTLAGCFDQFVKESASWSVTRWIAGLWVAGFSALLLRDLALGYAAFCRVQRLARVEDPERLEELAVLKRKLGVRTRVELCLVDQIHSPFAAGFFRHRIVLPRVLGERAFTSVVAHELAHVRERDSLFLALELLFRRVFFWHPLAYAFGSVYALSVEMAADELAVARAVSRPEFTSSLLEVASLALAAGAGSPVLVPASRGFRECKARLEGLSREHGGRSWRSLSLLAVLGLTPFAISVAQARTLGREALSDPKMCVQAKHEQLIESWLRIEPAPPMKCEK